MQPKSAPQNKKFKLCNRNYVVPVDGAPLCSPVLLATDIKELVSMKHRIAAHEKQYAENRAMLLESLEVKRDELHKALTEKFFDTLQSNVCDLQAQIDAYFESIIKHSASVCQTALKRLYLDIPDADKVKSVLQEVVNEYRSQQNVEFTLPTEFDYDPSEIPVPESWKVSHDANLAPTECRLKLGFGEVVGNFDESFKALHELVLGHE